jgi:glycosyltransferase involved in cell wall biosynthesis
LHSTGLPDHVEFPNRLLAPITDGFIGCAKPHGEYLVRAEGCPRRKVFVIPNGVDVDRFRPLAPPPGLREQLGLPADSPTAAIVAALRPEKNHELFLDAAALVVKQVPNARFLIIGDGPRRALLEQHAEQLGIADAVHFLGTRSDVPELLSLVDVLMLTSHMEANPVSILEGLACGKPVVATRVGSIPETVADGENGFLTDPGSADQLADRVGRLLLNAEEAQNLGAVGRRRVVDSWSLQRMVEGYQNLTHSIYFSKINSSTRPTVENAIRQNAEMPTICHKDLITSK